MTSSRTLQAVISILALVLAASPGLPSAEAAEVTVYSARSHYGQEPAMEAFTRKTGIQVRTFGGEAGALFERLKAEGERTPADVLISVDAGFTAATATSSDAVRPVTRKISFRDAIAQAIERNPSALVAAADIRRVGGLMEQVRAASLPTLATTQSLRELYVTDAVQITPAQWSSLGRESLPQCHIQRWYSPYTVYHKPREQ